MNIFLGNNGHGKSNLLEAVYILAIAKSLRATNEREMVRWNSGYEEGFSQVAAILKHDGHPLQIAINLHCVGTNQDHPHLANYSPSKLTIQKNIKVNGLLCQASELVGKVTAVMFTAEDIQLVIGSPPLRRRYLDILISQADRHYLRALQKYQKVLYQRNHLLRRVRECRSNQGELEYWDNEMITEGKMLTARRFQTLEIISQLAGEIHLDLTGEEEALEVQYSPSIVGEAFGFEDNVAVAFRHALEIQREREIAQGVSVVGPHRDDFQMLIGGMDAGMYASRGQARTVALALKLAEASYLATQRGHKPILLLDDVMSELDRRRRDQVLEKASQYEQCLITATEATVIGQRFLSDMTKFNVSTGHVSSIDSVSAS